MTSPDGNRLPLVLSGSFSSGQPPQRPELSRGPRVILIAAGLVIVTAGLRFAAPVLVPVMVSLFVVIVSLPALAWFNRRGVPRTLSILLIVLFDSALLALIGWILVRSAVEVRDALPDYVLRLQELETSLLALLHGWGVEISALPYGELVQAERLFGLVTYAARSLTEILSAAVLVLLFLIFLLFEAAGLPRKLRRAFGDGVVDLTSLAPIVEEVQEYLALKTLISLATGVLVGTAAWLLGVDFALFWGLLAFVLNYIPNIGSVLAAVPAIALALVQLGWQSALLLLLAYLAINLLLGNLLDPIIMGRRLGLSTFVVLFSLVFWGWVWGPVGMILSLPLTMAAKIALENTRDYRWIAVLLGPDVPAAAAGQEGSVAPRPGTGAAEPDPASQRVTPASEASVRPVAEATESE